MTVKIVPNQLVTMLTLSHTTLVILTIMTTVLIVHTHGILPVPKICQVISMDTRMTGDSHFVWVVVFMSQPVGLMPPSHLPRLVVLPTLVITPSSLTFSITKQAKTVQLLVPILLMFIGFMFSMLTSSHIDLLVTYYWTLLPARTVFNLNTYLVLARMVMIKLLVILKISTLSWPIQHMRVMVS